MTSENQAGVRKVMEQYMSGTFEGDVDSLKACFHPKAVMNGYLGDKLLFGTPEPFFQDMGSNPSMASGGLPYKGDILSLEIQKGIASVTLKEEGFPGDMAFINYFALLFNNGEWKIISKTFTTL